MPDDVTDGLPVGYTPVVCSECGCRVGKDHPLWCNGPDVDDDDEPNEPVGSCEDCGSDILRSEYDSSGLCDRCQWYAAVAAGRIQP